MIEGGITLFDKNKFTAILDGKTISLYTLDSGNGLLMQVINYGGRVVSLWVPDKTGHYEDVVLGYENIDRYLNNTGERYLGTVVGRYANRIANGKFELDGTIYTLAQNNGPNSLHGGLKAFDSVVWDVDKVTSSELHMSYTSADGEEGFPGEVKVKMIYTLTPQNEFKIQYEAITNKSTHVNLSHHSYFNLKGEGNGTAMDNVLALHASKFVPINEVCIPLGNVVPVDGTPFDFRTPHVIGERIENNDIQLKNGAGYDHCWVVDRKSESEVALAATVYEPASGRVMEVYTDQPGIQFYSSNWFDGKTNGKYNKSHNRREAIALETQKYPDTPNQPTFPTSRLNPGEVYKHTCIYKFTTK